MKNSLILLFVLSFTLGFSQAPEGYYSNTQGLNGFQLKSALKVCIDDIDDFNGFPIHQDQGYAALYDAYATENSGDTDDYFEEDGTVLDMYSEIIAGADDYNYEHFQNNCGNYSDEGDCYNREHLVPQSTFNSASPMRNDYFHVVPSDGAVNGARGSFPFGEVTNPTYTSSNGSKRGPNVFPGYLGIVFEPIDEFKGDIARSVLYFAIRYEDEFNSSWSSNQVLADNPQDFFVEWYINLLVSWHLQDPVSQREIDRNNNGFQFQSNRNPLIDHPEFVLRIWGDFMDDEAPTPPTNLQANQITNSSVELSWTPSEDNVAVARYIIEQDDVEIGTSPSNQSNFTVEDLNAETLYNFRVYAVDQGDNFSEYSNEIEITTLADPNYLINEDFDDCENGIDHFVSISEVSSLNWGCVPTFGENGSGGYQMNGFLGGQVQSLDWLITSHPLNFDIYEQERLSLWAAASFGNSKLELLYSTAYNGNENPSNFEWQEIPNINIPRHPEGDNSLFTYEAQSIDISELSGENVYVAFRYNTTNGDEATRWTIDNFSITGESLLSNAEFEEQFDFTLYPNPSESGRFYLNFSSTGLKSIKVYDIAGKEVFSKTTYQKRYMANLSQLPKGIYFIKINQDLNSKVKRLILN
ncbi:endonuclease [Psychroflexus tropicus]|uniref:endonuclease n=1 Tax=Psychroflexus tropicus TaxID=197345 RepID=UPI00036E2DD6|nr:endonuclease [Psychroflexus tropicus]